MKTRTDRRTVSRQETSFRPARRTSAPLCRECWNQKTKLLPAQWVQGSDPPSSPLPARAESPPPPKPALRPLAGLCRPAPPRPPGAPARPPGPAAAPAPRKGKESKEKGRRREGSRRWVSAPKRIKDGDGSGGGRLSLDHSPKGSTRPWLTPARRCWRPLGKPPAAEGDALARSPHLHPARCSPRRFCSILGILSEPNDLHTVPAQTRR